MAILAGALLVPCYLSMVLKNSREFTQTDAAFFAFLLFYVLVVAIQQLNSTNDEVSARHAVAILHLTACFTIFRLADFSDKRFRICLFGLTILMVAIVFSSSIDGSFYLKQSGGGDTEAIATYQGFSRSLLVSGAVLSAFTPTLRVRSLIYAALFPALFLAIARSEFFAFILFASIFEMMSSRKSLVALTIVATGIFVFYLSFDLIVDLLPDNRVISLISDVNSDTSLEARTGLTSSALDTILDNPFFGDYASYANSALGGESGDYSHTILSAWVDLGLLGFLLLVWALFSQVPLFARVRRFKSLTQQPQYKLSVSILLISIFLLLTAKDFTYMLTGAALGACAVLRSLYLRTKRDAREAEAASKAVGSVNAGRAQSRFSAS